MCSFQGAPAAMPLMPGALFYRLHPYLDFDQVLRDRMLSSETRDQHGSGLERIRYLLAPRRILRFRVVEESDLDHITTILFADAGEKVSVVRLARFRFNDKRTRCHDMARVQSG